MSQAAEKISVKCTHCGKHLKAPPSWIGKSLKCPGCSKTFTASAGGPLPAAAVLPVRGAVPKSDFVEDRKGSAEFKAMVFGLGLALVGAALSIGLWYMIASSTRGEARYVSLLIGPIIGVGMYLGYRKPDVSMGFIASMLALGSIIAGKYLIYHNILDDVTSEITVNEFAGPKAVAFHDLYEERTSTLKEYSDEEDPEGDKALADRAKLRDETMKEIDPLSDAEVRKRILDTDQQGIEGYASESVMTDAIHERGYAPDTAPSSAWRDASRVAEERLKKMTPAEKKKKYYEVREAEIRPDLPRQLAELEMELAGKNAADGVDPAVLAEKTKLVSEMSVDDLIVNDRVVEAERWQVSIKHLKDAGAKVATGLSFFSPRQLFLTLAAMGMAFTFSTGGKFKE